jgi:integrase
MARAIHRLNTLAVTRAREPGFYADGGGLYLQVSKSNTKSWVFRYVLRGNQHWMGLGSINDWSLADARERARECRQSLAKGFDPLAARRELEAQQKAEAARSITFEEAASRYIAVHESAWGNAKHREQWRSTLRAYAYPVIGRVPVSDVDTTMILKILAPAWPTKAETASRVRGRIEAVLDWATVSGMRKGENPARWKGHLAKALPQRSKVRGVKHHAALPYVQLPAFIVELRRREEAVARALELTILTALRTKEVLGACWTEFDFASKVWTVPAERMKGKREHRVPLSEPVLDLLRNLPRLPDSDLLFPGAKAGKHLSHAVMWEALARMGHSDITVHGFRSTFRDWSTEQTNFPNHVCEMALAHTIVNKVESAYRRGDLLKKRRLLMEAWAQYASRPISTGTVLPMRADVA